MATAKTHDLIKTIDLGKSGRFAPGREEEFFKAVDTRKDKVSFLKFCESKKYLKKKPETKKKESSKS